MDIAVYKICILTVLLTLPPLSISTITGFTVVPTTALIQLD
ncbi:MAG: hypothetical protein WA833_08250 [Nitrosotalea sp.]